MNEIGNIVTLTWTRPENGWTIVQSEYVQEPLAYSITLSAGNYIVTGICTGDANTVSDGYIYTPWLTGKINSGNNAAQLGATVFTLTEAQTITPDLKMTLFNPQYVQMFIIKVK